MLGNPHGDNDITGTATIRAGVTFAAQADLLAIFHPGRNPSSDLLATGPFQAHFSSRERHLKIQGDARNDVAAFSGLAISAKPSGTATAE